MPGNCADTAADINSPMGLYRVDIRPKKIPAANKRVVLTGPHMLAGTDADTKHHSFDIKRDFIDAEIVLFFLSSEDNFEGVDAVGLDVRGF